MATKRARRPRSWLSAIRRAIARGVVLPDRRDAVIGASVAVEVGVVDVVAPAPGLRAGGEIVEPVPAVGAAPGDHLARGPLDSEVVARVRVGLVRLGVDVELEVGPAVPIDEVQRVSAIGGPRIVVDEPLLRLGGVDGEDLSPHLDQRPPLPGDAVSLLVVGLLERRDRPAGADAAQVGKELGREGAAAPLEAIAELVLEPEVAARPAVEERIADDRLVRRGQGVRDRAGVDLVPEADEDDAHGNALGLDLEAPGGEAGEAARLGGADGRRGGQQRDGDSAHERERSGPAHGLSLVCLGEGTPAAATDQGGVRTGGRAPAA